MNQLPMPASGASTARFGRRTPPSSHGSVITGCKASPARSALTEAGRLGDLPPSLHARQAHVAALVALADHNRRAVAVDGGDSYLRDVVEGVRLGAARD